MEDHSTEKFKGFKEQQDKQKAIKVLLQRDMDSGRVFIILSNYL